MPISLPHYIASFASSPLSRWIAETPWSLTASSEAVVRQLMTRLSPDFLRHESVAIHRTATVESGATIKGPAIIGPSCFLAAGAYLRGGVWLEKSCTLGPGTELKSSFLFAGAKLAHFNFVGDSILGSGVNLEAGSIVANFRNERDDKTIVVRKDGRMIRTNVQKFGALIGDGAHIGANAVIAPGALIEPGRTVERLELVDQDMG